MSELPDITPKGRTKADADAYKVLRWTMRQWRRDGTLEQIYDEAGRMLRHQLLYGDLTHYQPRNLRNDDERRGR